MILDEFFKSKSTAVLAEDNLQGGGPDDEVKFFIDSEPAYYAVMDRFGDHIDFRGDDMVAPQRLWGAIQQTAGDAGGAADIAGLEDDRMGTNDELDEQGVAEGSLNESDKFKSWYDWKDQANSSGYTITKKDDKIVALNKQGQIVGHWSDVGKFLSGKAPRPNFKRPVEQGVAEDDAGDVEQRMIAKIAKYKEHLAQLKKTDPAEYKREMEKRKTSSSIPPVSTFEGQGVAEGSLNEFAVDGFGDRGNDRSKLLASVGRLLDTGNKVDWQVPGQMGHVTRVQDDGITMKKWKTPHSRMSFFLPMRDDSRDSKYTIKMVGPKHYAVVSAEQGVAEGFENLSYIGNCTDDDVIEHIFGDATNFAQAVEEHGDEFTIDDLVVKYDPESDVHRFYYKRQGVAEGSDPTTDSARDSRGDHRGDVKKNKDGSYVATNQAGSRKIFTSEKAAKAHARSGQQGVAESGYDSGDYSNDRQSDDYGRDLVPTGSGGSRFVNHGAHDHTRGRPAKTHGFSKNLPADPFGRTAGKIPHSARPKQELDPFRELDELSPATLASYKTKAGAAATAADSTGDRKTGDRRFGGIVKATKKQFDQDAKQSAQKVHESRLRLMASIIKGQ